MRAYSLRQMQDTSLIVYLLSHEEPTLGLHAFLRESGGRCIEKLLKWDDHVMAQITRSAPNRFEQIKSSNYIVIR